MRTMLFEIETEEQAVRLKKAALEIGARQLSDDAEPYGQPTTTHATVQEARFFYHNETQTGLQEAREEIKRGEYQTWNELRRELFGE